MSKNFDCIAPISQGSECVFWSNFLINTPLVYSLLEKRILYFITYQIKKRFNDLNLCQPRNWQDLIFKLKKEDLGIIGSGNSNIPYTFEALSEIGTKFMTIQQRNKRGEWVVGKVHWIDSFIYNTVTELYEVRISPEVLPYLINLSKNFTTFQISTALQLKSKFTQKFYELCCEYSDIRYPSNGTQTYKKNVIPMKITSFRCLFGLSAQYNSKSGKLIQPEKYPNYNDLKKRIIDPAQKELYELYFDNKSEVWFDLLPYERKGRKIESVLLFIYTKTRPKEGLPRIWQPSDPPISPFVEQKEISLPKSNDILSDFYQLPLNNILYIIQGLLNDILTAADVNYYTNYLKSYHQDKESYLQVLKVLKDKINQPKFTSSTKAYKRKSIKVFVLQKNLLEYGWSIPLPPRSTSLKETLFTQQKRINCFVK